MKKLLVCLFLFILCCFMLPALADDVTVPAEIQHGDALNITYDLSNYTFDHAEFTIMAKFSDPAMAYAAEFEYERIPVAGKQGSCVFTDTHQGDVLSVRVILWDANDNYIDTVYGGETSFTDAWTKPAIPSLMVFSYSHTSVPAHTPISADYEITGVSNVTECVVGWAVYDDEGWAAYARNYRMPLQGTVEMRDPTWKGRHYVYADVTADGWRYQLEELNQGIEVTSDGTTSPLEIELTFTDENGNVLDFTKDKAFMNQRIFMSWQMVGGYTAYEGYLNLTPVQGDTSFGSMGYAGESGTLDFMMQDPEKLVLEVEYHDNHGNSETEEIVIEAGLYLENGNSTWTWYTGLGGEWPSEPGMGSDTGIIQLRIPEYYWEGTDVGAPVWSVTNNHVSDAGIYDFTYEVESWNDGRGISLKPTWTEETVTGRNTYTVQCLYNGRTFESTEAVEFARGGFEMDLMVDTNEADPVSQTIGDYVPMKDGGVTLEVGKTYLFTGMPGGSVPATGNDFFLNAWCEGLEEIGRWKPYQLLFTAKTPGTYDFRPTLSLAMSNLVVSQYFEIRIADEDGNIPEKISPLEVSASLRQIPVQSGDNVELDWNVTGGKAPYEIEIQWDVQSSCLSKVMQTDRFTDASGTAVFCPPVYVDQVTAFVTATDSTGNTSQTDCYTWIENFQHDQEASYGIENDMDYVEVGEPVSASWHIEQGRHTISNVRYRWVTEYRENGEYQEISTEWVSADDPLTGHADYTTVHSGLTYLSVAFDAEDGWGCPGGVFDKIQVLNPGEVPLTLEVTIDPEEPRAGDIVHLAWNVSGASAETRVRVEWGANEYSGEEHTETEEDAALQGTKEVTLSGRGDAFITVYVEDDERNLYFSRNASAFVEEDSRISVQISPENPKLGEKVTISWEINRTDCVSAGFDLELSTGNLTRHIYGEDLGIDLMTSPKGSVEYVPEEGDELKVWIYAETASGWFEETAGPVELEGSWDAPAPIEVSVTYPQSAAQTGDTIRAEYKVTGGSGKYNGVWVRWVRRLPNGDTMEMHARSLEEEGTMTLQAQAAGQYGLIVDVMDETGWELHQNPDDMTGGVTVTGETVPEPLGISVIGDLPQQIDLQEGAEIAWDVTGGNLSEAHMTHVHIETDDGIVLDDSTVWGFTVYWWLNANGNDVSGSKTVQINLTPMDESESGTAFSLTIPVVHSTTGGTMILPGSLTAIEEEAFLNVPAGEYDIPDSVTSIGQNAFPKHAVLIVGNGSYAESWAQDNGYSFRVR